MFNNGDLAKIEWIIENGGIEYIDEKCTSIILTCERCKCREFKIPVIVDRKEYNLRYDGTIESIENFETTCNQCGLVTQTAIITYTLPKDEHPRRKLLEQAKYGSLCLDPDGD